MMIQILGIITFNVLISLPVIIAYSILIKIDTNYLFLKKLKIFMSIVVLERSCSLIIQLIFLVYSRNIDAIIYINKLLSTIDDYIVLPVSIIGVLILLYGLINIKERGNIND